MICIEYNVGGYNKHKTYYIDAAKYIFTSILYENGGQSVVE